MTETAPAAAATKIPKDGEWTTGMLDIAEDPVTGELFNILVHKLNISSRLARLHALLRIGG